MQIRIQAVHWECGAAITLKQFMVYLKSQSSPPLFGDSMGIEFKARRRLVYVEEMKPGRWGLLFVTVKSAKAFLKLARTSDGGISFVLHQIDESQERVADFNFLLMDAKTGRGAYAHYHQSCGFDDFTQFCRDMYRDFKDHLIGEAKKDEDATTQRAEDQIKKRYKGLLYGAPMLTKGDVARLVKQLAKIETLELTFSQISVDRPFAKPLEGVARVEKRIYRLDKSLAKNKLLDAVTAAIRIAGVEKGRVVGESDDKLTRIVNLRRNLGVFSELDFRQTVAQETFDVANLKGSRTLKAMLELVEDTDYEGLFAVQERGKKDEVGDDD